MSAMNEAPENVAGHLVSPKDPDYTNDSGRFVNKTRNFHIGVITNRIFFPFRININSWVCVEQPLNILLQTFFFKKSENPRFSSDRALLMNYRNI